MTDSPSKTAVRNAGSVIRSYRDEGGDVEQVSASLEVLTGYRRTFMEPMELVHRSLAEIIVVVGIEAELSNRLKKLQTIIDKLFRESGLKLDRMHDYGGCRAVVSNREDLIRLRDCVVATLDVKREYDYILSPRASGYRAIHLIVLQNERLIEIQLRTKHMHKWAQTAEAFSSIFEQNFKQDGEHKVQQLLFALAELSNAEEEGGFPSQETFDTIDRLTPEITNLVHEFISSGKKGNDHERN